MICNENIWGEKDTNQQHLFETAVNMFYPKGINFTTIAVILFNISCCQASVINKGVLNTLTAVFKQIKDAVIKIHGHWNQV